MHVNPSLGGAVKREAHTRDCQCSTKDRYIQLAKVTNVSSMLIKSGCTTLVVNLKNHAEISANVSSTFEHFYVVNSGLFSSSEASLNIN